MRQEDRYPPERHGAPRGDTVVGRCARCRGELYRGEPAPEGLCPFCAAWEGEGAYSD